MPFSFWEIKNWFTDVDYTIVGSGIVGIQTAIRLREKYPEAKILILEKGLLPQGASTKNAGFACFGSLSEIVDDLESHSEEEVLELISKRWKGLSILRKQLGDQTIDFRNYGGYEIFEKSDLNSDKYFYEIGRINRLLHPLFDADVFSVTENRFGFRGIRQYVVGNKFEAQIDTGNMMQALLREAQSKAILILNMAKVLNFHEHPNFVEVAIENYTFKTRKLLFATNGFAAGITNNAVRPARAQVLITAPIEHLAIKGTFHMDRGFYYFRNIGSRILLGGGRNLDIDGETTSEFGRTQLIQDKLESLLKEVILPDIDFSIEHRWSGIMGMGEKKSPIVKQLSERVYCGVRLGGMGVAIGSLVGRELADLV